MCIGYFVLLDNIRLTRNAVNTLNRVYTDKSIYDVHEHFQHWFIQWNYIFHQYVRESVLSTLTTPTGTFMIGKMYIYFEDCEKNMLKKALKDDWKRMLS